VTLDPATIWVIGAALLYWLGGRASAARRSDRLRLAYFLAGLATILIALDTPIHGLSDQLLWVHMVQHVLLLFVAPPLLALARPWTRMWRGLPLGLRRAMAGFLARSPSARPLRASARLLTGPVASALLFNVLLIGWHLPVAYDATLSSPGLHVLEHLSFFAAALLFWTRVIDSPPWRSPLTEPGKAAYLAVTLVTSWMLAVVLTVAGTPLYSHYADMASRPGGISALTDQQLAAGMMWVPGSIPLLAAILLVLYGWLEPKPSRATARRRELAGSP
jgi:cytochrome c oxidase assembly factor CtaG